MINLRCMMRRRGKVAVSVATPWAILFNKHTPPMDELVQGVILSLVQGGPILILGNLRGCLVEN